MTSNGEPDDPLQRQRTPSPLPDIKSERNKARSPVRLSLQRGAAGSSNDVDASSSSPYLAHTHQPLIRFDDEATASSSGEAAIETSRYNANQHALSSRTSSPQASPRGAPRSKAHEGGGILLDPPSSEMDSPSSVGRQGRRDDTRPDHIALPAQVDNFAQRDEQGQRRRRNTVASPDQSPGEFWAEQANRARRLSFKRRRGLGEDSERSGPTSIASNLFKRASMATAFGRRRSLQPGGSGFRRVNTTSAAGNFDGQGGEDSGDGPAWERKPRIPSIMPASQASPNSTPIPTVPFVVLCLVCFGEFSSAGVAGPFLFFQIDSFNVGGESDVSYWAGVVASVFFFAQFLTSMLWASAAQKHGRRAVLLVSLLGNAITLVLFGMATNLKFAISVRLAQGLFNGAVGVAKGAVRDLTDESNEGRAMAQLGFAWGMGGIIGPLIGGLFCNPADKFPGIVGNNEFLTKYPYVLPCLIVASFTASGAFLTLFISHDGGPRTGAIYLPEKIDVERATNRAASIVGSLRRGVRKQGSGYFAGPDGNLAAQDASASGAAGSMIGFGNMRATSPAGQTSSDGKLPRTFTQQVDEETGGPPTPLDSDDEAGETSFTNPGTSGFTQNRGPGFARPRLMSRTTARHRSILGGGSAYGYDDGYAGSIAGSARPQRQGGSVAPSDRRSMLGGLNRRRQPTVSQYAPDFEELGDDSPQKLSFAQRFLLANDDAVLGLSDLWVAAAIKGDDTFAVEEEEEYDDFGGMDFEEDQGRNNDAYEDDDLLDESVFEHSETRDSNGSIAFGHDEAEEDSPLMPRHLPPINFARRHRLSSSAYSRGSRPSNLRVPNAGGRVPSVYNNTGIEGSPLFSPGAWPSSPRTETQYTGGLGGGGGGGYDPTLAGIPESTSVSGTAKGKTIRAGTAAVSPLGQAYSDGDSSHISTATITQQQQQQQIQQQQQQASAGAPNSAQQSLIMQLPLSFIAHYCLLGFHSSTFDQVFLAFLVTPFKSGGLGLTAAHYAELIAALAFAQIGFQFYFYPKVGPPQGKLSHLAMMRLGTMLYLPVYVLFASLRIFLHPSTDAIVMIVMIVFASLRLMANVCAFTSVSILMNATTQPHLVPLANGLAQTLSSAARFIGPLLGGMLWANGISGGYETHTWPFNYWLGFEVVGLLGFAGFLHSWLIR